MPACGRMTISMWPDRPSRLPLQPDILVNKAGKMLNVVQNGLNLQLHRWFLVSVRWFAFLFNSQTRRSRTDQRCFLTPHNPPRRFELKRATGRAFEPLARARLRSNGATPVAETSSAFHPFLPTNRATQPDIHSPFQPASPRAALVKLSSDHQ